MNLDYGLDDDFIQPPCVRMWLEEEEIDPRNSDHYPGSDPRTNEKSWPAGWGVT